MKLFRTLKSKIEVLRRGNFGRVLDVRFDNMSLFSLERTDHSETAFVLGHKCFCRRLPTRYALKDATNSSLMALNLRTLELAKAQAVDQRRAGLLLFIVDHLGATGGVETRLLELIKTLYEDNNALLPVLLTQRCAYTDLFRYPLLRLDFKAPHFSEDLRWLIVQGNITQVEFHFKKLACAFDADIPSLKQLARVGCYIHERLRKSSDISDLISAFDYALSAHQRPLAIRVKNWVQDPLSQWDPSDSPWPDEVLLISRGSREKLPHIRSFLELCRSHSWRPVIAMPLPLNRRALNLLSEFADCEPKLIGSIQTYEFLKAHANRFLFAAGLGQVPFEVASFGMPSLVCPVDGNTTNARFLTVSNLQAFDEINCVVRKAIGEDGTVEKFLGALSQNNLDQFKVAKDVLALRGKKFLYPAYLKAAGIRG